MNDVKYSKPSSFQAAAAAAVDDTAEYKQQQAAMQSKNTSGLLALLPPMPVRFCDTTTLPMMLTLLTPYSAALQHARGKQ